MLLRHLIDGYIFVGTRYFPVTLKVNAVAVQHNDELFLVIALPVEVVQNVAKKLGAFRTDHD